MIFNWCIAEHMLFYASEKYPLEDSYSKYITEVTEFIYFHYMYASFKLIVTWGKLLDNNSTKVLVSFWLLVDYWINLFALLKQYVFTLAEHLMLASLRYSRNFCMNYLRYLLPRFRLFSLKSMAVALYPF